MLGGGGGFRFRIAYTSVLGDCSNIAYIDSILHHYGLSPGFCEVSSQAHCRGQSFGKRARFPPTSEILDRFSQSKVANQSRRKKLWYQ